jgi:23S rRNA (cytidine1920-2'-O)/16S rRNA (cytidine1409-2'-O)-methyltransferase
LLSAGARRVYAVDAGHGQLLGSLRLDSRVVNLERTNLGALSRAHVSEPIELVTLDLSYLSLARAVPQLRALELSRGADAVALVKPQFELGLARPPEDEAPLSEAVRRAAAAFSHDGWTVDRWIESGVRGARGAVEFFLHAVKDGLDPAA